MTFLIRSETGEEIIRSEVKAKRKGERKQIIKSEEEDNSCNDDNNYYANLLDEGSEEEENPYAANENLADGSEAGTDKGETPKVVVTNEAEEDDKDVVDLEEILREMEADMKDDKEKVDALTFETFINEAKSVIEYFKNTKK